MALDVPGDDSDDDDRRERSDRVVVSDDGARLGVQVHGVPVEGVQGPHAADGSEGATLVLAHGWTLDHRSWDPVVAGLGAAYGIRIVTWDQRGHGSSTLAGGRRRGGRQSIEQLGHDLAAVIAATAPTGPLVLGGHSMGGMTVMAYAGQHPAEVASRVRGVGLVSTSAGGLAHGIPRAQKLVMAGLGRGLPLRPGPFITTRGQRDLLFGEQADPASVALTRDQVAATPLPAFGGFHGALMRHDQVAALATLGRVPVRVIVGERDRLTPLRHARALVDAMPHADLEVVPGAGHMLTYEATERVVALFGTLLAGV